ncbi:hypothetical protein FACS1894109_15160 [Spirochaetia bacterium]|nr:hypothetical protein FACS1894109_15160 [Spirochaetia bacterium]
MNDTVAQYFTGIETEKRKALLALMDEWRESLNNEEYKDWFNTDGFFPNYYNKQHKVLFVGREARGITSGADNNVYGDYIGTFLGWFKAGIQNNNFGRHLMTMVQLFKSDGKIEFEQLMKASDYGKEMVKTGDFGFAFMNISKYSNDTDGGGEADWDGINQFLEDSQLEKHNYFQDELKLLDPEYIITGNLWNGKIDKKHLDLCFGKLTELSAYPPESPEARLFEMDLDGKKIKLVDVYHFSSIKSAKESFFTPIKELLFPDR